MFINKIEKYICLPYGVNLYIDIELPIDEIALANPDYEESSEKVKELIVSQITGSIMRNLESYASSELPSRFLAGQNIVVTTKLIDDNLGTFDRRTDIIRLDPDRISLAMDGLQASFLFGHEMGHKIQKYKNPQDTYGEIANFFGMGLSNDILLREIYSDIVGNMASQSKLDRGIYIPHLQTSLSPEESNYIKKRVLNSIYRP